MRLQSWTWLSDCQTYLWNRNRRTEIENRFVASKGKGVGGGMDWEVGVSRYKLFTYGMSKQQFSSVTQSCPTLCDPMNHSTPGLPVHHQLPESTQTHVHWVGDAVQPSHPLSSPSPHALNLSQHQGHFKWVNNKVLLYSTENYIQDPMINHNGREY